jgi:hypothetical protein
VPLTVDDDIDAMSFRIDPRTLVPPPRYAGAEFSVDRASAGRPGTAVRAAAQADRAAHVFITPWPSLILGLFLPGVNFDLYSALALGLENDLDALDVENPLLPVVRHAPEGQPPRTELPAAAAFPIDPYALGTVPTRGVGIGFPVYFSLRAGSASLGALNAVPSDVLSTVVDDREPMVAYGGARDLKVTAPGAHDCRPPACDDVDAMFVDHLGSVFFSLARMSPTLVQIGASAADVLQPGGNRPVVFLPAGALGLDRDTDDLDGLDLEPCRFTALEYSRLKNLAVIETGVYCEVAQPRGLLTLGKNVVARDGSVLMGDRVRLGIGSDVANVVGNTVQKSRGAKVRGVERNTLSVPLVVDATLRAPESCQGPAVEVPTGTASNLAPGLYGVLRIRDGGRVVADAGPYRFCAIHLGKNAQLEFRGDLPSMVYVAGALRVGTGSTLGPQRGTPPPSIDVGGRALTLRGKHVVAHLRAPEALVSMGRSLLFQGSLLARRVRSDHSVRLGCAPPLGE